MKLVYQHENRAIIHSAKNILELSGIDSYVKNDNGNTMGAEFGITNTLLELWLTDDDDYPRAVTVLERELINPPQKPQWRCPKCGEMNEGSFEVCWNCQQVPAQPWV